MKIPESYQGDSLKSLIDGDAEPDGWREDFFCEHFNPRYSMSWQGLRGERFKYARYTDQDPPYEFLHDLENDPDELVNFAKNPEYAAILTKLRLRTRSLAEKYANANLEIE